MFPNTTSASLSGPTISSPEPLEKEAQERSFDKKIHLVKAGVNYRLMVGDLGWYRKAS
jgi:hypothetical protein